MVPPIASYPAQCLASPWVIRLITGFLWVVSAWPVHFKDPIQSSSHSFDSQWWSLPRSVLSSRVEKWGSLNLSVFSHLSSWHLINENFPSLTTCLVSTSICTEKAENYFRFLVATFSQVIEEWMRASQSRAEEGNMASLKETLFLWPVTWEPHNLAPWRIGKRASASIP